MGFDLIFFLVSWSKSDNSPPNNELITPNIPKNVDINNILSLELPIWEKKNKYNCSLAPNLQLKLAKLKLLK